MSWRIHDYRALLPALCGLVLLALSSNAVVWTFCPHLNAGSHDCVSEGLSDTSAKSATMRHEHHPDMAMDEEPMPLESATGDHAAGDIKPSTEQLFSIDITQSQNSCSHCMMHSAVNWPSTPLGVNTSGSQAIAPAALTNLLAPAALSRVFVYIHDHGPPGLHSSRYILNSTFRI